MKTLFTVHTPYGDTYYVNEKGLISRDGKNFYGNWIFSGLQNVKSNEYIPFVHITKELIAEMELLYKNGNPRYTVRDIDHGTTRIWGNTKYHGVKHISFKI